MQVYRIGKKQYANDLSGTGSKLYGGRWNAVGTPCIYTSASRALAVLEYSVNVNIDFIPKHLCMTTFEIEDSKIHSIPLKNLPKDWNVLPSHLSSKTLGTELLQKDIPIIRFPSVVIPSEFNYILNPLSSKKAFKLIATEDFSYDLRIKA